MARRRDRLLLGKHPLPETGQGFIGMPQYMLDPGQEEYITLSPGVQIEGE